MTDHAPIHVQSDLPPFAMIPRWLEDAPISDRAYRLYGMLTGYAAMRDGARPTVSTLSDRLGTSDRSVQRARSELERVGAVCRHARYAPPRNGDGARELQSLYVIHARPTFDHDECRVPEGHDVARDPSLDVSDTSRNVSEDPENASEGGVTQLSPPVDNASEAQDAGGDTAVTGGEGDTGCTPGGDTAVTPTERTTRRETPGARADVRARAGEHPQEPGGGGDEHQDPSPTVRTLDRIAAVFDRPDAGDLGREDLTEAVTERLDAGWTPTQVVAAVTDRELPEKVYSFAGVILSRVRQLDEPPGAEVAAAAEDTAATLDRWSGEFAAMDDAVEQARAEARARVRERFDQIVQQDDPPADTPEGGGPAAP